MNSYEAFGLRYVCHVSHPRVNGGQPLPMFEPAAPQDRPSINTLEGWSTAADRINRRSFISEFGREPMDQSELDSWVYSLCTRN